MQHAIPTLHVNTFTVFSIKLQENNAIVFLSEKSFILILK